MSIAFAVTRWQEKVEDKNQYHQVTLTFLFHIVGRSFSSQVAGLLNILVALPVQSQYLGERRKIHWGYIEHPTLRKLI